MLRFYLFNSGVESSGDAAVDAINLDTTNKAPKVSMAIGLPVTVTGCPARRQNVSNTPLQRILKDLLGTLWVGRVYTPQVGLSS